MIVLAGMVWPLSGAPDDGAREGRPPGLFGLNRVVPLDIEVPAEEYRALQPPAPAARAPAGPPSQEARGAGERAEPLRDRVPLGERDGHGGRQDDPRRRPSLLRQRLLHGRRQRPETFLAHRSGPRRARGVPRPARYATPERRLDPSKAREALAFARFREAGVPAPRTALAEVTLTVPGEHPKAYLGLYTLVEPVDRAFLKDRFQTDKGLLLRPQGLRGLDFLGDDWEKYRGPFRPLAEPTPDEARRFIEFVRIVQQGDDERFCKEIASYLDVDRFLRFMAVQSLIANADGFFTLSTTTPCSWTRRRIGLSSSRAIKSFPSRIS